jgi:sterol O-acyltransferase
LTLLVLLQDWWTASSHAAYFRKWNIVVNEWLLSYIYRDFSGVFIPGKRFFQALIVFIISAIFHEYVLTFTFRFFYPMLLVAFGVFTGVQFWTTLMVMLAFNVYLSPKFV